MGRLRESDGMRVKPLFSDGQGTQLHLCQLDGCFVLHDGRDWKWLFGASL
jgi:hypothetical protein